MQPAAVLAQPPLFGALFHRCYFQLSPLLFHNSKMPIKPLEMN